MNGLRSGFFEGLILFVCCAVAMQVQLHYRIALGDVTLGLTWMGIVFAMMAVSISIRGWLEGWLGSEHILIVTIIKLHSFFVACILAYLCYALLLYVNALGDAPVEQRLGVITSKGRSITFTENFEAYEWATIKSRDAKYAEVTLMLSRQEAEQTWPGQVVALQVRPGLLNVAHVIGLQRDEESMLLDVLKVAPTAMQAMEGLIRLYAERGNMPAAVALSKRYLALSNDPSAIWYIAAKLFQQHRLADAFALDMPVYEKSPTAENTITIGWILAKMGRHKEGLPYLLKGVAMDPASMLPYYHLAYVQAEMGLKEDAIKNFREVLKRKPNYPEIREELRRLGVAP